MTDFAAILAWYDDAHRLFTRAVADRDRLEAEFWLSEMKAANAALDAAVTEQQIARAVRDVELYTMAASCQWWWVE